MEDGEADAVEEGDAFEEEDVPDALGVFEGKRFEEQRRKPTTAHQTNISNPPPRKYYRPNTYHGRTRLTLGISKSPNSLFASVGSTPSTALANNPASTST